MKNSLTLKKIFLSGLFLTQLYSCTPPLYFPNGINAPLFSKKGQFTMNAATDGVCTDIQMATSTSDKVGILLNINFSDYTGQTTSSINYNGSSGSSSSYSYEPYGHKHSFFEGGAGIYNKLGKYGRTESFALIGFGSASSFGSGNENTGNYMRFAIQSDIGVETNGFEGIMSCRMGYLNLNANYSNDNNNSTHNYIYRDPSSFFVDPAITFRLGYKGFKITTQLGLSIPLNGESRDWNPGWCTIGLQLRFQ